MKKISTLLILIFVADCVPHIYTVYVLYVYTKYLYVFFWLLCICGGKWQGGTIAVMHRLCGLSDYDDVALYFHVFAKFQ